MQNGLQNCSSTDYFSRVISSKDQRELRELVQYRKSLVGERTRELNRLQKMLEGANIKLSGTVTNINGKSARKILEYILSGNEIDEKKYDEMYEEKLIAHNLKASKEQILDDLKGFMSPLQRRMLKELLQHLDELNVHIENLNDEIDNFMKPEEKQASQVIQDVTGIGNTSAQTIIAVIGYGKISQRPSYLIVGRVMSGGQCECKETEKWKDPERKCIAEIHAGIMCTCSGKT